LSAERNLIIGGNNNRAAALVPRRRRGWGWGWDVDLPSRSTVIFPRAKKSSSRGGAPREGRRLKDSNFLAALSVRRNLIILN